MLGVEYPVGVQTLKKLQAVATSVATACCSPQNNFKVLWARSSRKKYFYFFSRPAASLKNRASFLIPQLDIPIGDIEEVTPTLMRVGRYRDVHKRPPARALRLSDERHADLVREPVSLARVAGNA